MNTKTKNWIGFSVSRALRSPKDIAIDWSDLENVCRFGAFTDGAWPSGKATAFDAVYRRFESYRPSHHYPNFRRRVFTAQFARVFESLACADFR